MFDIQTRTATNNIDNFHGVYKNDEFKRIERYKVSNNHKDKIISAVDSGDNVTIKMQSGKKFLFDYAEVEELYIILEFMNQMQLPHNKQSINIFEK